MDTNEFNELLRRESMQRAVTVARLESTLKEYEAKLLEGDYAGAEICCQKLHDLYDIVCDSVASVVVALRKLHSLE